VIGLSGYLEPALHLSCKAVFSHYSGYPVTTDTDPSVMKFRGYPRTAIGAAALDEYLLTAFWFPFSLDFQGYGPNNNNRSLLL